MLAAGLATSMAQNVYSLNVVGYVNVTLPALSFSCIANPLDATMGGAVAGGNDLTNLLQSANGIPASSTIATWNSVTSDYNAPSTMGARNGQWDVNFTMNPGLGALFYNAGGSDVVVTFVGQVEQGSYNVGTLPGTSFTLGGSPVPIGGSISNSTVNVGLVPNASDTLATWNSGISDWNAVATWAARGGGWDTDVQIAPGEGFIYYNAGADNLWTSNFTVQ